MLWVSALLLTAPQSPAKVKISVEFVGIDAKPAVSSGTLIGKVLYVDPAEVLPSEVGKCKRSGDSLSIEFPLGKTTFVAASPFYLKQGGGVGQLPLPAVGVNNRLLLPAESFAQIVQSWSGFECRWEPRNRKFFIHSGKYDLIGFRILSVSDTISLIFPTKAIPKWKRPSGSDPVKLRFDDCSVDLTRLERLASEYREVAVQVKENGTEAQVTIDPGPERRIATVETVKDRPEVVVTIVPRPAAQVDTRSLEKDRDKWALDVVVLDAGHGGKDPGALGVSGLKEKSVTLDVVLRLDKYLRSKRIKTVLTRSDDTFVPLSGRTSIANKSGGKVFVSLHCNSQKKHDATGIETYFLAPTKTERAMGVALRENSVIDYEESRDQYRDLTAENYILLSMAQATFTKESQDLAGSVQAKVSRGAGLKDRGVDQAGFYVLIGASMPAILFEMGFLSNKQEEKKLQDKAFRQQLAEQIGEAVIAFLGSESEAARGKGSR